MTRIKNVNGFLHVWIILIEMLRWLETRITFSKQSASDGAGIVKLTTRLSNSKLKIWCEENKTGKCYNRVNIRTDWLMFNIRACIFWTVFTHRFQCWVQFQCRYRDICRQRCSFPATTRAPRSDGQSTTPQPQFHSLPWVIRSQS